MGKPLLNQSSHFILALANAHSILKNSQSDLQIGIKEPIADASPSLSENFKSAAEQEVQTDPKIESNAIRLGGFLFRCLAGIHMGEETDTVEINYGYSEEGNYHYFELYPEFCYRDEEFDNLSLPLQAAYLRITKKIENFLEDLSSACDYEEGEIQSETGSFYFNSKTNLYKILSRYATKRKIDINSIDKIVLNPIKLDFEGHTIDRKQHDLEITGLLNQRIASIAKESPDYEEELVRYALQQPFVNLRELNSAAYMVKHVNTPQTMNTAIYFALLEEAAKLEDGINRDFEGPCFDYRGTLLRPTIN